MTKNNFREAKVPVSQKIQDKLQVFGFKLGSNKVLCAMRDGFGVGGVPMMGMILPVIIATLFFNNATMVGTIPGIHNSTGMVWVTNYIYPFLMSVQQASSIGFTLLILICISYFMSKSYVKNASILTSTILSIACFFALAPFGMNWLSALKLTWNSQPFEEIKLANIGTYGLIPAIFVSITVPYFFGKLTSSEKLKFKMPDTIPSAISDVLSNVLSITIMLCSYCLMAWTWALIAMGAKISVASADGSTSYIADNIFTIITTKLGTPLQVLATSPWWSGGLALLMCAFWIFGIHGTNLWVPILIIVSVPSAYMNIYFWAIYTNSTVQESIQNSPGTSINDAYYNLVGNLSNRYWELVALSKLTEYTSIINSASYQEYANATNLTSDETTKLVTAVITENYNNFQSILASNPTKVVDSNLTQLFIDIVKAKATLNLIDPEKGVNLTNIGYGYRNGLILTGLSGVSSSGGTGNTLGLMIAILLFSKFKPYKKIAKISFVPGIFGINEPIVFGMPIVLNFIIAIPYLAGTFIVSVLSHYLVIWHLLRPTVLISSTFIPAILLPYLNSGFDWRAIPITLVMIVLSVGYYGVFLKMSTKYSIKMMANESGLEFSEYIEKNKEELFVSKKVKQEKNI